MAVQNPKELFVRLLSSLRQGSERGPTIYQELSQMVDDPEIKEALEARAFVAEKGLATVDQCFKLIGEVPTKVTSRVQDTFLDEFRKELSEIQDPATKRLYFLIRATHLTQLRIAEYSTLVSAADITGHWGVGVLLESCLADRQAFVERTRRIIRHMAEAKVAKKVSERVAAQKTAGSFFGTTVDQVRARTGNEVDPAAEKQSRQARADETMNETEKGHPPLLEDGLYLPEWPVDWMVGQESWVLKKSWFLKTAKRWMMENVYHNGDCRLQGILA